ncbi:GNAT family N-acetyltransferase [Fastidiosibacter lacustris]|uniref:GNAT family N-acetyltransferase n=1 Tax=Fastidiosibacter lacustris TaxID=2056695 RepID=UPI000E34D14F|nr:GNAT family N-acetyltransferase [Fastidiosibacter lacustris]
MMRLKFEKVNSAYKAMILSWLSEKHVQEFYYGDGLKNTLNNLELYCQGVNDNGSYTFNQWVAFCNDKPFGFLITTFINGPYDPNHNYDKWYVEGKKMLTLDLLIGAKEFLDQGLSYKMIKAFILDQFSEVDYFIINPEKANTKAIYVYEKPGFKSLEEFLPTNNPKPHLMMRLAVKDLKNG